MENELLEKGFAELRRARAAVEAMHEEFGSERAVVDQAFDLAKCKLAMAIVLAGGSNWIVDRVFPDSIKLMRIVRGHGGLEVASHGIFNRDNFEYEYLLRLVRLFVNKADDEKIAMELREFRNRFGDPLRTCDNMIAIRGRFFRFVNGKYEMMC